MDDQKPILDEEQQEILAFELKEQFRLQLYYADDSRSKVPEDQYNPNLSYILKRNKALKSACEEGVRVRALEDTRMLELNTAIEVLNQGLALIEGNSSRSAMSMRQELLGHRDELLCKKANWFANQSRDQHDAMNHAIQALIAISSNSPHYLQARMELFQLRYSNLHEASSDKYQAFRKALRYLQDDEGRMIALNNDNQKVVDGYLLAATGIHTSYQPSSELAPTHRLGLLQFISLKMIATHCKKMASSEGLLRDIWQQLADELDNVFATIHPNQCNQEHVQAVLKATWISNSQKLMQLPLTRNILQVIKMINHQLPTATIKAPSHRGIKRQSESPAQLLAAKWALTPSTESGRTTKPIVENDDRLYDEQNRR